MSDETPPPTDALLGDAPFVATGFEEGDPIVPDPARNGTPVNGDIPSQAELLGNNVTPLRPGQRRRKTKVIPPKPRDGALVKPLTEMYMSVGMMIVPFDQPCGMAVVANAEECAKSLEKLARENPAMRRAIMAMVETSVWGTVIAAHLPILMAIAMHHVPAIRDGMGAVPVGTAAEAEEYLRRQGGAPNGG